ncbi:SH3 domain-containing protein [Streptomyces mexicanus]|uniref:SH3 domain-containing protein n=1 Tax=Streptomyces mexicanus TaxID=178566 RepID=UPI0031ED3D68
MSLRSPLARLAMVAASGALLTTAVVAPAVAGDNRDGTAAPAPGPTPAGTPQPAPATPAPAEPSPGTATPTPGTATPTPGTGSAAPGTGSPTPAPQHTEPTQPATGDTAQPAGDDTPLPGTGAEDPRFYRGRVTARGGLALRTSPERGSKVIRVVPQGEEVWIHCKTDGENVDGNHLWYLLVDGAWAWGSARYIDNIGPAPRWC